MSTALYRRYRPENFAEVIGQDHVTEPLMQALRTGKISHAYLFSGPRGCGKTSSARILARTLNCAKNTPEAPLALPCGDCPSCVELARGGSGSLDVVEIDAASHGGVDDARDLRERATFAPSRDRYKIFIIDEAHMVSSAGFNALLKIVEEPPPHIKFIFATTEPDKVIGTIRSRTHHYPFRLVPPDVMGPFLGELCRSEGITLGEGVASLVTRAGGGSVRDSLSIMDQLIAGAQDQVVDSPRAIALLGYTSASLLDVTVDAIANHDGAALFRVVDDLISSGHEPRRFVEDLLERLRDLMVLAVSGISAQAVLRDVPADQLATMRSHAEAIGVAELSRSADLVNTALTQMAGATSPRLHLELLCARLVLPGVDGGLAGIAARVDRLEQGGVRLAAPGRNAAVTAESVAAGPVSVSPTSGVSGAAAARAALKAARQVATTPAPDQGVPAGQVPGAGAADHSAGVVSGSALASGSTPPAGEAPPAPSSTPESGEAPPVSPVDPQAPSVTSSEPGPSLPAGDPVTAQWDAIVDALRSTRATWSLVKENARVAQVTQGVVRLSFASEGLVRTFSAPRHTDAMQDAIARVTGLQLRVEAQVAGSVMRPAPAPVPAAPEAAPAASASVEVSAAEADAQWLAGAPRAPMTEPEPPVEVPVVPVEVDLYEESSADDPDLVTHTVVGVPLVVKTLQGKILEERLDGGT